MDKIINKINEKKYDWILLINIFLIHVISAIASISGYKILFDNNLYITIIIIIIELIKFNSVILILNKFKNRKFSIIKILLIVSLMIAIVLSSIGIYSSIMSSNFNQKIIAINKIDNKENLTSNKIEIIDEKIKLFENYKDELIVENKNIWSNIRSNDKQIEKLYADTTRNWVSSIWEIKKQNNDYKDLLNDNKNLISTYNDSINSLNNNIISIKENNNKNNELLDENIIAFINISNNLNLNIETLINLIIWLIIFIVDPLGVLLIYIHHRKEKEDNEINIKSSAKQEQLDKTNNDNNVEKYNTIPAFDDYEDNSIICPGAGISNIITDTNKKDDDTNKDIELNDVNKKDDDDDDDDKLKKDNIDELKNKVDDDNPLDLLTHKTVIRKNINNCNTSNNVNLLN